MSPPFVFPSSLRDLERDTDGDDEGKPLLRPHAPSLSGPSAPPTSRSSSKGEGAHGSTRTVYVASAQGGSWTEKGQGLQLPFSRFLPRPHVLLACPFFLLIEAESDVSVLIERLRNQMHQEGLNESYTAVQQIMLVLKLNGGSTPYDYFSLVAAYQ